jgi:chromosome segregation ATPase
MTSPIHTITKVSYQLPGCAHQDFSLNEEARRVAMGHLAGIAERINALALRSTAPSSGGGAPSADANPFVAIAEALRAPYDYVINRNADGRLQMQIRNPDNNSVVGTFTDIDLQDSSNASASTSAASAPVDKIQAIWDALYNPTLRGAGGGAASSRALLAPHMEELILGSFIDQARAIKAFKESGHLDRTEAISNFIREGFNQTKVGGASCFQEPLRLPDRPESDEFILDLYLLEDMKRCMEQDPKGFKKAAVSFSLLSLELNINTIAKQLIRTQSLTPGLLDFLKNTHIYEKLVSLREAAYQAQISAQQASLAASQAALRNAQDAIALLHETATQHAATLAAREEALRGKLEAANRARAAETARAEAATQARLAEALATISHQAEEISGLRATAESTSSLLSDLQLANKAALEQIAELTPLAESVPGLTQTLSQTRAALAESQASLSALKARFKGLSDEKAVSEASLAAINEAFLSSQAESLALERRLESLSAGSAADKAALAELRASLADSEAKSAGLKRELLEKTGTVRSRDATIDKLVKTFEGTTKELDAANREPRASLKVKEQKLQALQTRSAAEEARLKGEIDKVKIALEQFSATAALAFGGLESTSSAKLSALSSRLEAATEQLAAFKAANEAKQRDQASEIASLKGQLAANSNTYRSSLEALTAKLDESTALTGAQKAEIESLTEAAAANQLKISGQSASISQLERRLATTDGSLARVSSAFEKAQAAIKDSEAEKAAALQTNEDLRIELAALTAKLAEQNAASSGAIEDLRQALGAKEAQRALEASGKAAAAASLQQALASIGSLTTQVADLQAAAIASAASKAELEAQVEKLTQSGAAKTIQIQFLKRQQSARQEQIAKLQEEQAGVQRLLDSAQSENSRLQAAVASKAQELAAADGRLSVQAEEIAGLTKKLGESSSALEDLKAQIEAKDRSHLEELGLRDKAFSELRASHAADFAKEREAFTGMLQSLSDRNTELEALLAKAQDELGGTSGSAGLRSQFAGATSALEALTGQIEALKERFGEADLEDIKKIPDQILALKEANSALQAQVQALSEANLLNKALKERFQKAHQGTAQKLVALGITSQAQATKLEKQAALMAGLERANAALLEKIEKEGSLSKAALEKLTKERDAAQLKLQEATELFRSALEAQGSAAESEFKKIIASLDASDEKLRRLEGAQAVLGKKFSEQTALLSLTQRELADTGATLGGKTALLEKREAQLENIADHLTLLRQRKVKSQLFNAWRSDALTQKLKKAESRISGLETRNSLLSIEKSTLDSVLQGHLRELERLTGNSSSSLAPESIGAFLSDQSQTLYNKLDGQLQLIGQLNAQLAGQQGTIRGLEEKRNTQAARILELEEALLQNEGALAATQKAAEAAAVEHRSALTSKSAAHEEASALAAAAAATAATLTARAEALEARQGTLESEKAALKAANLLLSGQLAAETAKAAQLGAQASALERANGALNLTLEEVRAASALKISELEKNLRATKEANSLAAQAIGLQLKTKEDANEALGQEIAALKAQQKDAIAALERTHAGELSRLGSSKDAEKAELIAAHEATIAALQSQHEGILNPLQRELAAKLAELEEIRPALAEALAANKAQSALIAAQGARLAAQDEELRGLRLASAKAVAGLEASALELAGAKAQALVEADALQEQAEAARGEFARLQGTIKDQVGGAIAALRAIEKDIPELKNLLSGVDVEDPSTLEKLNLASLSKMFAHKITALAQEAASSKALATRADAATGKAMAHNATLAAELEALKPTIDALAQAKAQIAAGVARELSLVAQLEVKTRECAKLEAVLKVLRPKHQNL